MIITVQVKIIEAKGYIKKGEIGIGWRALRLAARVRDAGGLDGFPTSLEPSEWERLAAEKTVAVQIDDSAPYKAPQKSQKSDNGKE
jgi:hypothetical protein